MKSTTSTSKWGIFIFMLLTSFPFFAQKQISGQILDAKNQPLAYANVLLIQPTDSVLVVGNISDEQGKYILEEVAAGSYLLRISMIGYEDQFSEIFTLDESKTNFSAPTLTLKENTTQLDEVQVVAKRALFEQKIDRMVVNVENSITSAGTNALEVLKRSPGVLVNSQTNTISMSGKDGVNIMINGKVSRLSMEAVIQMLGGMSSDNIERVELIHTPPSNFDAEGNAGFINIVLKKNQGDGFNGGFSVNAGYGKKEKSGANFDFNYRKNRANLYGGYSWRYNNNPQVFKNYRSFIHEGVFVENVGVSDRDPTRTHFQNARLGLDYQWSDKTIFGALISMNDRHWTMDALNDVRIYEDGALVSRLNIPNDEVNHSNNIVGNINLQHQITSSQKLNVDLDYAYFNNDNPSSYVNQFFDSNDELIEETELRVQKKTPMRIWVGKADYSNNLSKKLIVEGGLKITSSGFDNDILVEDLIQGEWTVAPLFTSVATMKENILAAYTSTNWKVNEKTDIKVGLRYEYTDSNLGTEETPNIVDRQYGRWFPSFFVSNKVNENNTLQFSYSRRINRPSFRQLAPFFIFFDPNTVGTGNPALQPATTDAIKATYIFKTMQLAVQYAYTADPIGRFQPEVDQTTNTQVNGAKNFQDAHLASATISFPIIINKWWEIRTSWTGQWNQLNDELNGEPLSLEQLSWNMNGSSSFKLPKKFSAEISGFYYSPAFFGIVNWQSFSSIDIGIQKEFNNNHGTLRLGFSDIFLGSNWTGKVDDPDIDFQYEGFYGLSERVVRLTYSRRFGNNKVKGARKRAVGSAEEQRRAN